MEIVTTSVGLEMLLRWGHFLAGITWIGLLYYINFVQAEYFKIADPAAKADAVCNLVPRVLNWFRWGALATLLTGLGIFAIRGSGMSVDIYIGALLGIFMYLNVWVIIYPAQLIVIASSKQVSDGGEPIPEAADALARGGLASRSNVLFSVPMLFFMGASTHYPHLDVGMFGVLLAIALVLVLEYNAAYPWLTSRYEAVKKLPAAGKMGPMASVTGVIHCGLGLTVVLYLMLDLF